eukprot:GDKI01019088.1.p1 GENE.GDKI01019088.1~~GDKI01019088.1.p1  ORF type:complete len:179 (-),score=82.00 GDKI01019088.1:36-572(-)
MASPGRATLNKAKTFELEQDAVIQQAFELFDEDGSGSIDIKELETKLLSLGFDKRIVGDAVQRVMENVDADSGNSIQLTEFHNMLKKKLSKDDEEDELLKSYRQFDAESKGVITLQDLKRVCEKLGEDIDEETMKEMILEFARTPEGKKNFFLTVEEFKNMAREPLAQPSTELGLSYR